MRTLASLFLSAGIAFAQVPARDAATSTAGTGRIQGRIATATGSPLVRAEVQIGGLASKESPSTVTDSDGRYEFSNLPAGRYTLLAWKNGYVMLAYGQRPPHQSPKQVELANGQSVGGIDIALPRSAAIVARVTNELGEPLTGLQVSILEDGFVNGERRRQDAWRSVGSSLIIGGGAATNDLGETRIYGLMAGAYFLSAIAGTTPGTTLSTGRREVVFSQTFYPGTPFESEAVPIVVRAGEEVAVSFPLLATRGGTISGFVRGTDGLPRPRVALRLTGQATVPIGTDGSFTIRNLSAGEHLLTVRPATPADPQEYGEARVRILGNDVTGLNIVTTSPGTVRGQIVFDSPPPEPRMADILRLSTSSGALVSAGAMFTALPDWRFEMSGLVGPTTFRLSFMPNPAWFLKSITLQGKDVTDIPLDINSENSISGLQVVLTQRRTEIAGVVKNDRNTDVLDYVAIVFPRDREKRTLSRYIGVARPDQQGGFRILGLPAGNYLAAAVENAEPGEERHPPFLERLSGSATVFTLGDAESKAVTLRLIRGN